MADDRERPPDPAAAADDSQPPAPAAASSRRRGRRSLLLVVVALLSCAALGLATFAVVDGRDDEGRIAGHHLVSRGLAGEFDPNGEDDYGWFGYGPLPGFGFGPEGRFRPDGEPRIAFDCSDAGPTTEPGLGPQPRSPDELDPVLEVGQEAVVSYRPIECEQPVVFRIRVDDASVLDTAPSGEYPTEPSNGTYVAVTATIEMLNGTFWPSWFSFSLVGPDYTVVTPLYSDSLFSKEILDPGDDTTATLVFDAPEGYDLVVFDDHTPGSVSWRL